MLRLHRVCRARYANLDGHGAKIAGGRWNSPGNAVVYLAESLSLAVLENLVHMDRRNFPSSYVHLVAHIPDRIEIANEDLLRSEAPPSIKTTQNLGDFWLSQGNSLILKVRSQIVPLEHNFLLNPAHPMFDLIWVDPPVPFEFDIRLFPPQGSEATPTA